jgi:diguanylate cyclase (GGDEF)-like protein/PAS domain S-box-containing protein
MATLGEIIRWIAINVELIGRSLRRAYRRAAARLLRRDQLVAATERKFSALLEAAPDAMVIIDWHGHIQLINAQSEKLFGWPREELLGQSLAQLIPERFHARHRGHVGGYLRHASSRPMGTGLELWAVRRDGSEFPVEISLSPLETDQGLLVSASIRDITARKRAEEALRAAEEQFRTAFEEAPIGMVLADLDGRLLQVNRAMCEITGHSEEQLAAATLATITHPVDFERDREELRRMVVGETSKYRAERRFIRADGELVPVDLSIAVVRNAAGDAHHFLVQVDDITERKRFEGQLQYLADHDALTGMFNRRRFEEELAREFARARRYGGAGALLAIDLDHFKYVNDSLGHSVGDELITRVGGVFRQHLRATDIVSRLGGDEFTVILPGASRDEAVQVAENLLSALRTEGRIDYGGGTRKRVTASIGIAMFAGGATSAEELVVDADIAMYDAKEAGRDRVQVYDSAANRQQRMQARLTWVDRIRDAIETDGFELHAQPILSLNGDHVPRHELLLRMRGEGDDLVPPGTFLYIAERFDIIQPIDRWVLRKAIGILAEHKRAGREIHLEVNLSAKSVTDPELPAFVELELERAGIDGHGLCVEITETAAIVNVDRAKRFAHTLGEFGVEFALDDFGAGFASFYYLKHMAFDYVKIDGEFIRNLPSSRVNKLVVQSVVDIARGLGKRTIAEFVGDAETLSLLEGYGVDYAQGFYVAKPMPLDVIDVARAAAVKAG